LTTSLSSIRDRCGLPGFPKQIVGVVKAG